jgi:tetratricopeptide (TPR) repeat protein
MAKKKNHKKNSPKSNEGGKKKQPKEIKAKAAPRKPEFVERSSNLGFWANRQAHVWIVLIFGFLLYANTLGNEFAVDDSIVIQRNKFTKKGLKGMSGIWGEDTFVGFFGGKRNLVSGGRYRPFTVAMFALENQLFGRVNVNKNQMPVSQTVVIPPAKQAEVLQRFGNPQHKVLSSTNEEVRIAIQIPPGEPIPDADGDITYLYSPFIGHLVNAILFGLLCMVLYLWMLAMFDPNNKGDFMPMFLAFTVAMLFAAHPLHTEAVANIKGRDEIMVTLGSVLATYWTMKSIGHEKWLMYMGGAVIAFFIALFSKESAIPFLAIIPAAIYFFRKDVGFDVIALRTVPFLVAAAIFWFGVRNPIIYSDGEFKEPAIELMNDPFMKLVPTVDGKQKYVQFDDPECKNCGTYKYGMILWTWAEYLRLLAVPQPLTNDYYPKYIRGPKDDIPKLTDPKPLLSLLIHLGMAVIAFIGLLKRKPYAFALIFYAATFSVVSNLFFPIGTNMAERFMFMPSIGFSMICGLGLLALGKIVNPQNKEAMYGKTMLVPLVVFGAFTFLYSIKTFVRNLDWKNDYTLFTQDIDVSPNSAKLNNAVSGVLQDKSRGPKITVPEKTALLEKALGHSKTAIELHPTYNNAWLLYGNANTMLAEMRRNANRFDDALKLYNEGIRAYNEVNRLRPDHADVPINMTVALREKGKLLGEKMNKIPEAMAALQQADQWAKGTDFEVLRLLGVANGLSQNHTEAIKYFTKALELTPKNVSILFNLEIAYRQLAQIAANQGDEAKMNEFVQKANEFNAKWKEINPNYNPQQQSQEPQGPQKELQTTQ